MKLVVNDELCFDLLCNGASKKKKRFKLIDHKNGVKIGNIKNKYTFEKINNTEFESDEMSQYICDNIDYINRMYNLLEGSDYNDGIFYDYYSNISDDKKSLEVTAVASK